MPRPYNTPRRRIVLDVETTGLDPMQHEVVEVAWHCIETGDEGAFVPPHSLANASAKALQVNRYFERLAEAPRDTDGAALRALHAQLAGARLIGANIAFDAAFVGQLFRKAELPAQPWHFRLLDIEAYGAGVLGIGATDGYLPGLSELARKLSVIVSDAHTALADVRVTAQVYKTLCSLARHPRAGLAMPMQEAI